MSFKTVSDEDKNLAFTPKSNNVPEDDDEPDYSVLTMPSDVTSLYGNDSLETMIYSFNTKKRPNNLSSSFTSNSSQKTRKRKRSRRKGANYLKIKQTLPSPELPREKTSNSFSTNGYALSSLTSDTSVGTSTLLSADDLSRDVFQCLCCNSSIISLKIFFTNDQKFMRTKTSVVENYYELCFIVVSKLNYFSLQNLNLFSFNISLNRYNQ